MTFDPDWCVAPGEILTEWMEEHDMTSDTMAIACSMLRWDVDGICSGRLPIGSIRACKLAQGTGIDPQVWLNLEKAYRDGLAAGKIDGFEPS